ncbi:MAG: hypothetical protein EPO22_05510 [Dehalococcoidia bacterium]|nr:MAG: hypothetical protein EPO22_05510 [Dehalococcoidia bacterium]
MLKRLNFQKSSAGTFVPCGTYLNTKRWEFHGVPPEGEVLDGEGEYYRVPLLLVLGLGPLIGLAFILFLPIAVPLVLIYGIGKKISGALHGRRPATFDHRPGGVR